MIRLAQFAVLLSWFAWLVLFTLSTDILIHQSGPRTVSERGWKANKPGLVCTYFTTLGMTNRFLAYSADASAGVKACPDRLWQ